MSVINRDEVDFVLTVLEAVEEVLEQAKEKQGA